MRLLIFNRVIVVEMVPKDDPDIFEATGCYIPDRLTIKIRENLPAQIYRETLLHEVWHVVVEAMGLHNESESAEEQLVCLNTLATVDIFRNNPDLVEVITGG